MKRIFLFLVLINGCLFSQVEYSRENAAISNSSFFYQASAYKSKQPGKTRIDSYVQVPYSSLSFVKKENEFDASYSIILTLYDENKDNILSERNWKEKIRTSSFEETLSRKNFNLSYKALDLTPGNYVIKIMLEDGNSSRTSSKGNKLTVRAFADSVSLSDVMLITEIVKDSSNNRIVPNISNFVTNRDDSLSFFFTLYSNREQEFYIEYYVTDPQKNNTTKQLNPYKAKTGANVITSVMKKLSFAMGNYDLKIVVKDKNWKEITSIQKPFTSGIYGIPLSIVDLDKAVTQLIYIATGEEKDFIEEAKDYSEKLKRFLNFWDKKKPNPSVEENPILIEYYRRIEYANKNFKGFSEGWRSDMGMIYVTFGPPSQVERHPMDSNSKPYEIWYYYELDRSFVFVDDTGFNDYRLYNPDYSRWPGYRQ